MEAIPRKYGEWGQFDRYCKLVLYHEAIDYLREMKCRRDREVSLDALSPADWDKLSIVDRYSCDSFILVRMAMTYISTTSLWPKRLPACQKTSRVF